MGFEVTQAMQSGDYELVVLGADPETGLQAVMLGPALGGTRMYVERLQGACITAEEVGTTENMVQAAQTTRWVSGLPRSVGGSGDPSPLTARGVIAAMRAAAEMARERINRARSDPSEGLDSVRVGSSR